MNSVALMGRLTHDVEMRQTPNGVAVCSFTIAVDAYSNGEKKANFINCVAWRGTAENIARYFSKGNMIGINGSIQTRQYKDKGGNSRIAFEILVDKFHFAGVSQAKGETLTQTAPSGFETVEDDGFDLPF